MGCDSRLMPAGFIAGWDGMKLGDRFRRGSATQRAPEPFTRTAEDALRPAKATGSSFFVRSLPDQRATPFAARIFSRGAFQRALGWCLRLCVSVSPLRSGHRPAAFGGISRLESFLSIRSPEHSGAHLAMVFKQRSLLAHDSTRNRKKRAGTSLVRRSSSLQPGSRCAGAV